MPVEFSRDLCVLILVALTGGVIAKLFRLHSLLGFIVAGVFLKILLPSNSFGANKIAELGLIFLLFTTGLELSIEKLARVLKIAVIGAGIQIVLVSIVSYLILISVGMESNPAIVLSLGFSLSSTAVVVKILMDKGEADTIHGEVMIGWLLVQDLAVIPILVVINLLGIGGSAAFGIIITSLLKAAVLVAVILVLGRIIVPRILHWVASLNSRELLLLASIFIALGTALATSAVGISTSLGAFLAGVIISGSIEKHAIFAEVRPLRDLFVGIFFVSLGLLVNPSHLVPNLTVIVILTVVVVTVKLISNFIVSLLLGYHGKTAVAVSLGLSQVGEFSFILFSFANGVGLLSDSTLTVGVSTALLSLIVFPSLYKQIIPLWHLLKNVSSRWPTLGKYLTGWDRKSLSYKEVLKDHVIICGFGRVGSWVGKALESLSIPFIVVEYNQRVVNELKAHGTPVIYGDPTEKEVLEAADIAEAKVLVVAIPDKSVQEGIITLGQTLAPKVKIISRVHTDEEWERLKVLKVDKIVQPEFEAAVGIVRSLLLSMGKPKEDIACKISGLRHSRSLLI